jgi:ABC-type antimicrobial peptide transport system permease subunit
MGIVGGPIGCIVGSAAGAKLGMLLDSSEASAPQFVDAKVMLMSIAMACLLALIASWIPAVVAAQQDPADILREE